MQYILTKEEYEELVSTKNKQESSNKSLLEELCMRVANSEPIKGGWSDGKVWGCIYTVEHEWYCDDCPVNNICTKRKNWSK